MQNLHPTSPVAFPSVSVRHNSFGIDVPSITLERGEIMGIFGKSGSGKTTYMKRVRESFSPERVHYMSQYDCLLEEITIRQNIELGLACSDKPASVFKNWEQDFAGLLQEFEVDRHLHKYPRMMSGGQRKRAEIVRCLMMDPEILLLDEPFQGIGHLFESVSTKYILKRAEDKRGVTAIVSHDFDLLCRFSKKILLVDDKGVIEMAPTGEKGWKPGNLRSAWTLGVENLIPGTQAPSMVEHGSAGELGTTRMLAFWGRGARWATEGGDLRLKIKRADIGSQRTFQRHGELYTQVEMVPATGSKPLILIGAGTAQSDGDLALSVHEH